MSCIICQDSGSEPLQDNISCNCKYKRHNSCWIDYVHSTNKVKCLMCRKEIVAKATPKTKSSLTTPLRQQTSIPYTPELAPITEGQQISHQEFWDIVRQNSNTYQEIVTTPSSTDRPQQQQAVSKSQKLLKIALCLAIIVAIVVVVVILL